ncbi:uncharacterized protein LOC105665150 isoform X1 [Ceratitis capitata]|uniref:uncharacterized protein LOC105665150 isoform X1 n=1 Tax=Ceratitis capitata TaxID=7213 RepID=UPI0006188D33|nr:uncharacterized protein LOC105665150 isoform X1 [Ceratitis capitata]
MQTAADMPIELNRRVAVESAEKQQQQLPVRNDTVISTNGLKITSKLNPDAKEFYPSYLLRQKLMREIGDVGGGGANTRTVCDLMRRNTSVCQVIKIDGVTGNRIDTDVDMLRGKEKTVDTVKPRENIVNIVNEMKAEVMEKPTIAESDVDKVTTSDAKKESDETFKAGQKKAKESKPNLGATTTTKKQTEEDIRGSEGDSTDFEDAEGEPMMHMTSPNEHEVKTDNAEVNHKTEEKIPTVGQLHLLNERVSDEENRERYSDQSSNETLNEFKCKDDTESVEVSELSEENELAEEEGLHELPQIVEENKERNSLCGDGEAELECEEGGMCDCGNVGDGDVSEHILCVPKTNEDKTTSETEGELAIGGAIAAQSPPNSPKKRGKSITGTKTRFSKGKLLKEKDEKKKSEKHTTLRKLASISLSLRGKSSTHHAEKTTPRNSSTVMSRTKRLTESLHNLTMGHKSKSESKKSECSSRLLPRSITNIPRPPTMRTRTTLSRASTEANGTNYKVSKVSAGNSGATATTPKDDMSLKSVSSNEQCLAMKTTPHIVKKPTSGSKTKNACLEKSGIPTVTVTKSKDSVNKLRPRGTHASTLRQSEVQKRRSLFPDDAAVESNIELSQFLFK